MFKGIAETLLKALGRDTVEEMDTMGENDLRKVVVDANAAMKQVKEELDANVAYQKAKSDVSHLSQGKKEVDKRQKARSNYALQRLDEIGKLDPADKYQFEKDRLAAIKKREEDKVAREKAVKEAEERQKAQSLQDSLNKAKVVSINTQKADA
jgi:hypothetical protein